MASASTRCSTSSTRSPACSASPAYLIEPYDVKTWKEKIIYLKQHPEVIEEMSKQAKKLTEKEYNAKTTASYIVNDFIQIAK